MNRREFLIGGAAAAATANRALGAGPGFDIHAGGAACPAVNPAYLTGRLTNWPLEALAAAGYRGLEVTPACLDAAAGWRPLAERAGLRMVCVNAMPELRPYLTGSLSDAVSWRRRATLDHLLKTVERMRGMAVPFLVVAPSRLAENYQTPLEARALLIESLRELAAAGETEILLQSAPFRLFTSSKEIASIVDEAARPNIGACLDVGHAILAQENPAEAARTLGARLRYVCMHDADAHPGVPKLDQHRPLGAGSAQRGDVLRAVGEHPWSVGVTESSRPVEAAKAALAWLQER